jgi:hypothetical protein
LFPEVWRDPDVVEKGRWPNSLEFQKTIMGKTVVVGWRKDPKSKTMWVVTSYVKKEATGGHAKP